MSLLTGTEVAAEAFESFLGIQIPAGGAPGSEGIILRLQNLNWLLARVRRLGAVSRELRGMGL